MTATHPTNRARAILSAACAAVACTLLAAGAAQAQHRDDHGDRGDRGDRGNRIERGDRGHAPSERAPQRYDRGGPQRFDRGPQRMERAPLHFDRDREHIDARFHHDRVYLNRGVVVADLPHERYEVVHGGAHFFFSGGVWYRPYGPRWVVVTPPFGAYIPVLPPFYATLWVGGVPYYYADDVYYVYRGPATGYEVVAPPPDANVATQEAQGAAPGAPPSSELYIYPKNGQSEQQQAQDRYECHSWASSQTGFDPTAPNGGVSPDQADSARSSYDRAMSACLEGRGYTVK